MHNWLGHTDVFLSQSFTLCLVRFMEATWVIEGSTHSTKPTLHTQAGTLWCKALQLQDPQLTMMWEG